jgi:histidine ammonia-lyase/phenylalanine ammonia-lyase
VAAIDLLALCQAVDLRAMHNCHERSRQLYAAVRRNVPMHHEDRRMDVDIQLVLTCLRRDELPIGESRPP